MKTQAIHSRTKQTVSRQGKQVMFRAAIIAALSFFLPQSKILGGIAPFAVALTACLPLKYSVITAVGSLLGYLTLGLDETNMIYLFILGTALGLKIILQRTRFREGLASSAAISFLAFFLVSLAGFFVLDYSSFDLVLRICESVIAGGISCFLYLATSAVFRHDALSQYSKIEIASLGILLMIAVIGLCGVKLYGFNLGIIFGTLCLFVTVTHFGLNGAAVDGIILAISLCLYSVDFLPISAVLLVSGFLAGLFRIIGKFGQIAVFLACAVFSAFVIGISLDMLFYLMCMLIAAGLYLSIPERLFSYFNTAVIQEEQDFGIRSHIEHRLEFAAETIQDLQNSLVRVSKGLRAFDRADFSIVCNKTASQVCQSCPMRLTCWDNHYNETADAFQKLFSLYKNGLTATEDHLKSFRQLNCCRSASLLQKMEEVYRENLTRDSVNRKAEEVRNFAIEQLSGVSQMLWEVSEEISAIEAPAPDDAQMVRSIFTELAVEPQSVFCAVNQFDRMEVEIYTLAGVQIDLEELRAYLKTALKRDFAAPSVSKISNRVRISFYETAAFTLEYGIRQATNQRDTVCGDSYEHFLDNKGNAYFILSDGMGSGKRAALDSTMTCGIILKLIKAGLGMDSILKFVNSSLQIKSAEESLSTIDILKLDLYTGQADFYKAGSAASFAVMGGNVAKVETHSLPVGILQGVSFDHKTLLLKENDTILLASDGIVELPEPEILSMLRHGQELSCEELAEEINKAAEEELTPHDDLTTIVIRLAKGI